jgi:hypothetical protein
VPSNGGRSPSSGFPNSPRPQLRASHLSQLQLPTDWTTTQIKFSYVTIDGQSASLPFYQAPSGAQEQILLLSDSCEFWRGASSLARRRVCRLHLLLVLVNAVILGYESSGIHDHTLLSQIRDSPTWRTRSPYLYLPGTEWPSYTPRHWFPFSSPPTTRRAAVEVF